MTPSLSETVILSAVRTPVGKFQERLRRFPATELGAKVVAEAVRRASVEPGAMGQMAHQRQHWQSLQNQRRTGTSSTARPSARSAAAACTRCVASLHGTKFWLRAQGGGPRRASVVLGEAEVVVAGRHGVRCPTARACNCGLPCAACASAAAGEIVDSMIHDGLWDVYENVHMGVAAELVADKYKISRQEQDQFALESHQRAVRATNSCYIRITQIVPVEVPQKKGPPVVVSRDESPRPDASLETLAKLRPAFKKDGTVTAGNAPGTNDGAAAVVVTSAANALARLGRTPMARIVAQSVSGIEPKWIMMAPVEAIPKIMSQAGAETPRRPRRGPARIRARAFAVAGAAVMRRRRLDPAKVNVNGGAVAIGHPIGASGARILVTLLYEMQRRNAHRGIAALCLGAEAMPSRSPSSAEARPLRLMRLLARRACGRLPA